MSIRIHSWPRVLRLAAGALMAISLLGCFAPGSLAPESMVGVPIFAVGHLGFNVGISDFTVDGHWGGNNSGWGGGGSTSCCVLVPTKVAKPITVEVRWTTCDISGLEFVNGLLKNPGDRCKREDHRATVPVHFAVPAGEGSGLVVHFLPAHRVEVWYSRVGPTNPGYPGPPFPRGPAPPYAPLSDEKPAFPKSVE